MNSNQNLNTPPSSYTMGYSDEFSKILDRRNAESNAAHLPAPWVGSQPCGAKYPGFCTDSKGV